MLSVCYPLDHSTANTSDVDFFIHRVPCTDSWARPPPVEGSCEKNTRTQTTAQVHPHLSVKVVPLDVQLSQMAHMPQVARDRACKAVAPQVQPLQALAVDHHPFRDAPVQVIVVQV